MNIFYGLLGMAAAYCLIRYRKKVIGFTGQWPWAEKAFGPGHTDFALLLLAICIFFLSITVMTGQMDDLLNSSVGDLSEEKQKQGTSTLR